MIAVVQGGLESPMFSCEESMDDEGNRVVACDYSGATVLDIDGTIPTGVRTETYDPEGRFMSWKWSDGAQYSCHYGETITCIFTSKEGEMCTDTFDYEGAFVKTTCEDDPLSIFSCSEEEGGGLLCDSELMNLSCYDRFDADLKLVEAGCGGLFNSSSACTVAGEAITCDVNWMGTDCDVEFDLLFNVESRSCVDLGDKCSWGDASKCGQGEGAPWVDPITDPCICAWRASALAVLCTDDFKVADTVDEPDTTDFISIVLSDARPIDGPMTDIWVDTEKLEFYVRITGSGHAGPDTVGPYWHGPFTLEDPECE